MQLRLTYIVFALLACSDPRVSAPASQAQPASDDHGPLQVLGPTPAPSPQPPPAKARPDPANIHATDFATTCNADLDCVAIIEGDCSKERCANAAIHRADFAAYREHCKGTRDPLVECRYEVGETTKCVAGTCSAQQ